MQDKQHISKSEQTKRRLAGGFIVLLQSHPINEITVDDIVEHCGLSRNAFYYHFNNIGELIEYYVKSIVDDLIEKHPPHITSLDECFRAAIDFAIYNAGIIKNVYHSTSRAIFERHLWHLCEYAVSAYISSNPKDIKLPETGEEMYVLREFLKFELFGFTIDYLNRGMPEDVRDKANILTNLIKLQNHTNVQK